MRLGPMSMAVRNIKYEKDCQGKKAIWEEKSVENLRYIYIYMVMGHDKNYDYDNDTKRRDQVFWGRDSTK